MKRALWRSAQLVALAATIALLTGLVWAPEISLRLLWKVVIPLVPGSLLLSPMLWRNVCPLATANMALNRLGVRRRAGIRWVEGSTVAGITLLVILVPARHLMFNVDGPVLAATIGAVALASLAAGTVFDAKGGWCNAICPVLPVERLYGASPLLAVGNARCRTCTACAPACIDMLAGGSARRLLGRSRLDGTWPRHPFGAFAAAFPGFVLGYFTVPDAPLATWPWVYAQVAGWSAISWSVVSAVAVGFRIPADRALPSLAAIAAGIYYAFAAPGIAQGLGLPDPAGGILRIAALVLVTCWWWRAARLSTRRAA